MELIIGHPQISFFDYWSIVHFCAGAITGYILIRLRYRFKYLQYTKQLFGLGVALFVFWEIIEIFLRQFDKAVKNGVVKPFTAQESEINIIADVIICLIAMAIVYYFYEKPKKEIQVKEKIDV
ncbi:MAG: hypothetical protein ABIA91_01730 [Patescibacteria group bacterium]